MWYTISNNDAMLALKAIIIYFFIYLKAAGLSGTVRNVQETMVVCRSRFSPALEQETFYNKLNHMDSARHFNTEPLIEKNMIITPPARSTRECRERGLQTHSPVICPSPSKFFHFTYLTKRLFMSLNGRHNKKAASLSGDVCNVQDEKIAYRSRLSRRLPKVILNYKDNKKHIRTEALIKKRMTVTPSALSMKKCSVGRELQRHHPLLCPPPQQVLPLYSPYQASTFITK